MFRPAWAIFLLSKIDMSDADALRFAFAGNQKSERAEKRARRADRTKAQALSPVRILVQVLMIPLVIISITLSIYIQTSPYERVEALRHLLALSGCNTAMSIGLAPAFRGEIGYHTRNDPDGDGIACHDPGPIAGTLPASNPAGSNGTSAEPVQGISGAKFLRP